MTINNSSVAGVGITANLNNPVRGVGITANLNQPGDDLLGVRLQRPKINKLFVYRDHGTTASYAKITSAKENAISEVFADLKGLLNTRNHETAQVMRFNLSLRTYSKDASKDIDITPMLDQTHPDYSPEIAQKYRALEELVCEVQGGGSWEAFTPGRRTSMGNPAPLTPRTTVSQGLPSDYASAAKLALGFIANKGAAQQDLALKRIVVAEKVLLPLANKVSTQINGVNAQVTQLQADLQNPANAAPDRQTDLNNQLTQATQRWVELRKKAAALNFQRIALYTALAFYPTSADPHVGEITQAAKEAQTALQAHMEGKRKELEEQSIPRKWIPEKGPLKYLRGSPTPVSQDPAYAVDTAALLFSGQEAGAARAAYYPFIQEAKKAHTIVSNEAPIQVKREGLEDELVAFALRGAEPRTLRTIATEINEGAVLDQAIRDATAIRNSNDAVYASAGAAAPTTIEDKIAAVGRIHNNFQPPAPTP